MEIAKMSAAQLTKAMEKASTESSKITQMMIDAGRGYEYPNEMMKKSDPLSLKYQKSASLLQDLYAEKNRRMTGQGNMRPIKYQGNPTMATEILERGKTSNGRGIRLQKRGKGYDVIVVDPAGINWVYVEKQVSLEKAKNRFDLETMQHKTNPTKRKFSPAQIAAQKLFAERARAGTLGKGKRKANPAKVMQQYTVFHRGTSNIAGTVREASAKAAKEKIANRLGLPTLTYLVARKTNPVKPKITDTETSRGYIMRASQATGRLPVRGTKAGDRLITRRKKALSAPAGYFPNPSTNRGLAIILDAIALGETFSESKLIEALDHPSLSVSDRNVIRDALKGLPYSHIRLQDAAMKIRNYKGERKTNPTAPMMTGYQVICMHPKKHVVGIFKTMAEAKLVARAMADAKNVPYAVKTVKVHKAHFAV